LAILRHKYTLDTHYFYHNVGGLISPTTVAVGFKLLASQAFLFLALLTFLLLSYRSARMFIPATDYQAYVLEMEQWEH
jgi:hypothetical protein